jgi:Xaa-Pro dipeptidase
MFPANRHYAPHLKTLQARYDLALARAGFDAVLIGSGVAVPVHRDDQDYPYRPEPLFVQWAPLLAHPGSALFYRPGRQPRLLVLQADDFWHQPAPMPAGPWHELLKVRPVRSPKALLTALPKQRLRLALIGDPRQWRGAAGALGTLNPPALLMHLDYDRAFKTAWEVDCIRGATQLALAGHRAVRDGFASGLSEYELGLLFLAACGQTDQELPYPAIVAMNENGATLHYQHRARARLPARQRHSLLLDAGCGCAGYASDVTRTHAARRGRFADMIRDVESMQQDLCALVRPGVAFPNLQLETHRRVAGLLSRWGLVRMPVEDIADARITDAFLPHGLGHLLGLQVHDVGGGLASPRGGELPRPARFPRLRLTRPLQPGMVVTIEPGIYFIDSLLARLHRSRHRRHVDWKGLRELRRCGGIRIEDDVLVTATGQRNLTRELEAA